MKFMDVERSDCLMYNKDFTGDLITPYEDVTLLLLHLISVCFLIVALLKKFVRKNRSFKRKKIDKTLLLINYDDDEMVNNTKNRRQIDKYPWVYPKIINREENWMKYSDIKKETSL